MDSPHWASSHGRLALRCAALTVALNLVLPGPVRHSSASETPPAGREAKEPTLSAASILQGYRRFNGSCSHCHGPDTPARLLLLHSSIGPSPMRDSELSFSEEAGPMARPCVVSRTIPMSLLILTPSKRISTRAAKG